MQYYLLSKCLKILFPQYKEGVDFLTEIKDGKEVIIKFPDGVKLPTQQEIDAVKIQAARMIKEEEFRELGAKYLDELSEIAGYSQQEADTFWVQYNEAKELLENPNAQAIFVRTLSQVRQIDLMELVNRILYKSNLFKYIAAVILGKQQNALDSIYSSTNIDEILNTKYEINIMELIQNA